MSDDKKIKKALQPEGEKALEVKTKSQAKTEKAVKTETEAKAEKAVKIETEAKAERAVKTETEAKAEKAVKIETEAKAEKAVKIETEAKAEKAVKIETEAKAEKAVKIETEAKAEKAVKTETEAKTEKATKIETEAKTERAENDGKLDAENISVMNPLTDLEDEEKDLTDNEEATRQTRTLSPGRLVLKRFFRSKLSIVGLSMIVFLFLFSFVGPIFSPWGETQVDDTPTAGPVLVFEINFKGADGEEYTVYDVTRDTLTTNMRAKPSLKHWLGTDKDGRDVLTRLMYGGRISLIIGFVVVFLSTFIGIIFGSLAGYFGKWTDQIIMRIVDIFNCVPTLPLLLIVSALYDAWDSAGALDALKGFMNLGDKLRIAYLIIIMVFFGWSGTARIVRGQILSLREQEYMVAAESLGLSGGRKIFKHLIPNVLPQLIVSMTLALGGIILYEATLSWLNLGVPMPYAAWGSMINAATDLDILENFFYIWAPPGFCIVLAVLGFNFVGDGLRDAFDPKMKR